MSLSQAGVEKAFDVLVIGSGLAGLSFCLQLAAINPHARIALIAKGDLDECNSRYAQGGIAAATGRDKLTHLEDTLSAGSGLCHKESAKQIIDGGEKTIQQLINYGVKFDKRGNDYQLAREGGHSQRRIYHQGDHTGQAIISVLNEKVLSHPQITTFPYHTAVNLIQTPKRATAGELNEIAGAYILDEREATIHTFLAHATVLATGGAGKVYRYTTNPMVATGDGVAMAYRAGARVSHMEFFQFHPTLLHHEKLNNFLISEALRGEGAVLLDQNGQRFMEHYAPKQMELATRDVVARAIFTEIEKSDADFVYLDISHKSKSFLSEHFPQIYQTLDNLGIDISHDPIPVVPAAHYQCGGVLATPDGRTDLRRLFAIGEVANTGLHGANRLASNSLLEAMVSAENAASITLKAINEPLQLKHSIPHWNSGNTINLRRASQINAHWRGLRGEMSSYAGIVRTEAGLMDLLELIQARKRMVEEYYWAHQVSRDFVELRNIITVAELITSQALKRRESRGGHYREDYPKSWGNGYNPKALEV